MYVLEEKITSLLFYFLYFLLCSRSSVNMTVVISLKNTEYYFFNLTIINIKCKFWDTITCTIEIKESDTCICLDSE